LVVLKHLETLEVVNMDDMAKECRKALFWEVYWKTRAMYRHDQDTIQTKFGFLKGVGECSAA